MDKRDYIKSKWRQLYKSYPTCNVDFKDRMVIEHYIDACAHYDTQEQIDSYFKALLHNEKFFPAIATAREYAGHMSADDQKQFLANEIYQYLSTRKQMSVAANDIFTSLGGMNAFKNFDITAQNAMLQVKRLTDPLYDPVKHDVSAETKQKALEAPEQEKKPECPF